MRRPDGDARGVRAAAPAGGSLGRPARRLSAAAAVAAAATLAILLGGACAGQRDGAGLTEGPVAASLAAPVAAAEPAPRGPWLGQEPPGLAPELFGAASFMSGGLPFHGVPSFTPDGTEVYWSLQRGGDMVLRFSALREGGWTPAAAPPFSEDGLGDDSPFVAPDGKRLYFVSRRPLRQGEAPGREGIWYCEREGAGWSAPRPVSPAVNALEDIHWQVSVDLAGDLYFAAGLDSGPRPADIYRAERRGEGWAPPERLGPAVNAPEAYDGCPNISPDGRRLLFARIDPKTGACGLYASSRGADGAWSEARSLDAVIPPRGFCLSPMLAPGGGILFWLDSPRGVHLPYWIDARVLEAPRG